MSMTLPRSLLALATVAALGTGFLFANAHASSGNKPAHCTFSAPRQLALDLDGITAVHFAVGQHDLRVNGSSQANGELQATACASDESLLPGLRLQQERKGDALHVTLASDATSTNITLSGLFSKAFSRYAYLTATVDLPENLPVHVTVGSGDAAIRRAARLVAAVGSGDLKAEEIRGPATVTVGSGDAEINGAQQLTATVGSGDVLGRRIASDVTVTLGSGDVDIQQARSLTATIGSGNLEARQIRDTVRLTVGSGEAELTTIGTLRIDALGSGDVTATSIAGDASIGAIESGNATLRRIGGNIHVRTLATGTLDVDGTDGNLNVEQNRNGRIHYNGVRGTITLPPKN